MGKKIFFIKLRLLYQENSYITEGCDEEHHDELKSE